MELVLAPGQLRIAAATFGRFLRPDHGDTAGRPVTARSAGTAVSPRTRVRRRRHPTEQSATSTPAPFSTPFHYGKGVGDRSTPSHLASRGLRGFDHPPPLCNKLSGECGWSI